MLPPLTAREFMAKWRGVPLTQRAVSEQHFADICRLVGHTPPGEAPAPGAAGGAPVRWAPGVGKTSDGMPWASAERAGAFAWQYAGKPPETFSGLSARTPKQSAAQPASQPASPPPHPSPDSTPNQRDNSHSPEALALAYQRLRRYRAALRQPPLLVAADASQIWVCANFGHAPRRVVKVGLEGQAGEMAALDSPEGLRLLRAVFFDPESLRPRLSSQQISEQMAADIARLAELLERQGASPRALAGLLTRLVLILFAEDAGLLARGLLARVAGEAHADPAALAGRLRQLFEAMAQGGEFMGETIACFDGGLFEADDALLPPGLLALDGAALTTLSKVSLLDWASLEMGVFGVLFERSLDPAQRRLLGAPFAAPAELAQPLEEALRPLRRRWMDTQGSALKLAARRDAADGAQRDRLQARLRQLLTGFAVEAGALRVLDPACGSGGRLAAALRLLLELEGEIIALADELGVGRFFPNVSPAQLYGLTASPYAYPLAQAGLWMTYLQWLWENGFNLPGEPVLPRLPGIRQSNMLPAEWGGFDVVLGN